MCFMNRMRSIKTVYHFIGGWGRAMAFGSSVEL
jgi:hypothetical protein